MPAERAKYPIKMMARILGVSRSGFCSWLAGGCPEDDRSAERGTVRRVRLESDRRFGFRFVKRFLPAEFSVLSLHRVRKLMHELGIRGCTPNVKKRTTIPDPDAKPRPDLVRRDFTGPVPAYKLVGDITCLRTGEGWLYLSAAIDLSTRMVAGWSLSERMTADIAVSALASAESRGYVAGNAISRADRGAHTLAGFWPNGRAPTTCTCPAAAPAAVTTTPLPSRSSPRSKMRCIAGAASLPGTPPSMR